MQQLDKWKLCDGFEEIFAMVYDDPEGGPEVLRAALKASDLAREDLEDAALGLSDAGMHKAAKIVAEFAKGQPAMREPDRYEPGSTNAKSWEAGKERRLASRRAWIVEQRRRKRAGTW